MVNNQGGFDKETGSYHPSDGSQPTSGKYNYAGFSPDQINGWKGSQIFYPKVYGHSSTFSRPFYEENKHKSIIQ